MQPPRIDSFAYGQVVFELVHSLPELPASSNGITSLYVNEGDRDVNERLQELPPGPVLGSPFVFQDLMALEEFAVVEEVDSEL